MVYLEDATGRLNGAVQAKQIAMKILELSRNKTEAEEMLPAIAYVLNAHCGNDLTEPPVTVTVEASLKQELELIQQNRIREIAVVDPNGHLVGTLDAKNILSHYLQAKAESAL